MKRGVLAGAAAAVAILAAPAAQGAVPASLHTSGTLNNGCLTRDAADDNPGTGTDMTYVFCDDGVPALGGGTVINPTGAGAITVPSAYGVADTFTGLPLKNAGPTMAGEDALSNIAIDADVSLPTTNPPAAGYPVVFMMHGCCGGNKTSWEAPTIDAGGERWHYSNAWFASRGYVVVNYTARGFVNATSQGSSGETQLDSRSFEINDYQALACNLRAATEAGEFDDVGAAANVRINPSKVVATGGSYGGGFSWLALTDPKWTCTADTGAAGTPMSLTAVAPKYGWTDLAYTLVPNGLHSQDPDDRPATDGCDSGPRDRDGNPCPSPVNPVGTPKSSIVGGLFASGTFGANHTTFPMEITDSFACLQGSYPLEDNPACATTLSTYLPRFLRERSAYYQNDWFANMNADASYRVPIFNAATFTDPLFPAVENRRMVNRILFLQPSYPIKQYYGDYQHFVQNKAKEWGDLCGMDRHVCTLADYPGGNLNVDPANLVDPGGQAGRGVTTRLNRFIDNFALPTGGYPPAAPSFDVTASLQVCPQNAADLGVAADEPGTRFMDSTFRGLAPNTLTVDIAGAQTTTSTVNENGHALRADPIVNSTSNGGRCPVETTVAGPGVASYTSDPLPVGTPATMIGSTEVTADFTLTGSTSGLQLNGRLYDVSPDGTALMVDRGTRRITEAEATGPTPEVTFELHGNGWRFQPGHSIRIELAQDDAPYVKSTTPVSSLAITNAKLEIPTREFFGSPVGGGPDPKPPTPSGGSGADTGGDTATTPCKKKKGKKKKKKKKKKCK